MRSHLAIVLIPIALSACRNAPPAIGATGPTLSARVVRSFSPHTGLLRQTAFSRDSQVLATSSVDGDVKLWRVGDGSLARTLSHPAGVTSIDLSPDGNWLASGSYDSYVRLWNLHDGTLAGTFTRHHGVGWALAFSPDRRLGARGGAGNTVQR